MLKEIKYKVLSYCDIPEELTGDHWLSEGGCDSYITHEISSDPKYDRDELDNWIVKTYPELLDVEFMIHLDW